MARNDLKIVIDFDLPVLGVEECPPEAFRVVYTVGNEFPITENVPVVSVGRDSSSKVGTVQTQDGDYTPFGRILGGTV